MSLSEVRKIVTIIEEEINSSGFKVDPPLRKVAIAAVVKNPYSGEYSKDLSKIIEMSKEINVLVLDDEENILETLNRMFFKEDFGLFTTMKHQEAMEVLGKEKVVKRLEKAVHYLVCVTGNTIALSCFLEKLSFPMSKQLVVHKSLSSLVVFLCINC